MLFTLGVMLAVFPPLSNALLNYNKVKARRDELDISTKKLEGKLVGLQGQTDNLGQEVARASGNLKNVQGELQTARKASAQARKDAAAARKNAMAATKRQQAAVKNEQTARSNLQKVRGQLGATTQQRAAALQQLGTARTDLKRADAGVKSAAVRVKNANVRAKDAIANAKFAEDRAKSASLSAKNAGKAANDSGKAALAAETQFVKEQDNVAKERANVAKLRANVAKLTAQSEQLQSDNDELNRINTRLGEDNQKYRDTAFILSRSDIRVPVDSTLVEHSFARLTTALDVRNELRAMFNRSAEKIVPGLLPDAALKFADLPSRDGKRLLTTDEIYDNLVNFIADNPNALSVRLAASRNYLAGETVLESKFVVFQIRPALPDNFELGSIELDGRNNEGPLFSALLDLVDEGTAFAKKKGVKPPLSPDVPNFYVPGSREQIFDTLREIKAIDGPARVRIVTNQAISTADQLSVKFEVEPISSVTTPVTTTATARLAPRQ